MTVNELVEFLQTEVPDGTADICIRLSSGFNVDVGLMRMEPGIVTLADGTVVNRQPTLVVMPVFALTEETNQELCTAYNPEDRAENYEQEV